MGLRCGSKMFHAMPDWTSNLWGSHVPVRAWDLKPPFTIRFRKTPFQNILRGSRAAVRKNTPAKYLFLGRLQCISATHERKLMYVRE